MSDRLVVSTRKGLFWIERERDGWRIAEAEFLGDNVTLALNDPRSGHDYAVLNHGHFGVKLHRRTNGVWNEVAAPVYPPKPEGLIDRDGWGKDIPYSLINIFALETGGPKEKGLLWCGTIPGGLFRSRDHGASWELIRALWDDPKRQQWMGGGTDWPAIHSICVDPRDSGIVRIGISCGGVWETRDGGETWACRADGMFAAYLPPPNGPRPEHPGPAPPCAKSERAGPPVGSAPQRNLPQRRRLGELDRDQRRRAIFLRFCGRRPSAVAGHGLVHPGDQG
ncbi:WD40/YVTN/BNR-like repeat-containing protein [Roseiarcus sp.]|uniref:WD40/YVTN/BNR-like repeat-containing protein n=1 Tax=Roseiarcus sp. TaxID=1969460 RepID=UPI003F9D4A8B